MMGSDWNYSSLSPQKFESDMSLESPMTAPRPVSQLQQLNGTMRAQRLMKLVPSGEMYSETSGSKTMHQRVNTVNGFYKNGRLRNIKLISGT